LADLKLPIQNKNATKNNNRGKVIFIPCNGKGNGKGMAEIEIRIKIASNIWLIFLGCTNNNASKTVRQNHLDCSFA
jgi:hypothetical protein